jgi:lactate racemase
MDVALRYGTGGLHLELPDDWDVTVIDKKRMPKVEDPGAAINAALESPIGAGTIEAEARGRASACILICDVTRPVPNSLVLRPLIERLLAAGLGSGGITILVATGLHRPNEGKELEDLIGDPWVLDRARVLNHMARRDEDHVALGTTSQGIPVRLDRRFLEADLRIAVGLVEPHFMAGWSGGRKVVLPGIAHAQTITSFHSTRMLMHAGTATCRLEGNPLHAAQREMLAMIGKTLSVNLVIDESRALSFASYGAIEESHLAAVRFAEPYFRAFVPRHFPVVLGSAAGFPLDATYYQAVKGICGGSAILRQGGDLFIAAECSEGFGSAEFRRAQERLCRLGKERFRAEASSHPHAEIDEWETVMLLKALDRGAVHFYSTGLAQREQEITGTVRCQDLAGELRAAVERDPERRLAVIPEGPYVSPEVRSES